MASGFKIIGVALAVFPLAIEGLKFYHNGCEKVQGLRYALELATVILTLIILLQDMRHYQSLLKEFIRELDMENAKFINTSENLFEDAGTEQLSDLLPNSTPEIWNQQLSKRNYNLDYVRHVSISLQKQQSP
jgi:hypothetical protein